MVKLSEGALLLLSLGLSTMITGSIILRQTPVLLLGISIMAASLALVGSSNDNVQLASSAWRNVAMLIEELGAFTNAVYVPSNLTEGGEPLALIPIGDYKPSRVPSRLSLVNGNSGALAIYSIGSEVVRLCRDSGVAFTNIDNAVRDCLIRRIGIARSIVVDSNDGEFKVRVKGGLRLRHYDSTILRRLLGSPTISSVAAILSEVTGKPIRLVKFEDKGSEEFAVFRVVDGG